MSRVINRNSGELFNYLLKACSGGCIWGEIEEFARARFTPADIDILLVQHGSVASLEELYAEIRSAKSGKIAEMSVDWAAERVHSMLTEGEHERRPSLNDAVALVRSFPIYSSLSESDIRASAQTKIAESTVSGLRTGSEIHSFNNPRYSLFTCNFRDMNGILVDNNCIRATAFHFFGSRSRAWLDDIHRSFAAKLSSDQIAEFSESVNRSLRNYQDIRFSPFWQQHKEEGIFFTPEFRAMLPSMTDNQMSAIADALGISRPAQSLVQESGSNLATTHEENIHFCVLPIGTKFFDTESGETWKKETLSGARLLTGGDFGSEGTTDTFTVNDIVIVDRKEQSNCFIVGDRVYVQGRELYGPYILHSFETVSGLLEGPDTSVVLCLPDNAPGPYKGATAHQLRMETPELKLLEPSFIYDENMPEEILLNGGVLIKGNAHLGVIYNNLVGLNLTQPGEYEAYLAYMGKEYGFRRLYDEDRFEYRTHGLSATQFVVGSGAPTRVTEDLVAATLAKSQRFEASPSFGI